MIRYTKFFNIVYRHNQENNRIVFLIIFREIIDMLVNSAHM